MINNKEFSKRLHLVMDYYQLSAAAFADNIQVGRSSISHILSGRNNPSLEFVMKLIKAFPDVELYWLLNGTGNFPKTIKTNAMQTASIPKTASTTQSVPTKPQAINSSLEHTTTDLFSNTKSANSDQSNSIVKQESIKTPNNTAIERIVIFYSDGSFESYSQK